MSKESTRQLIFGVMFLTLGIFFSFDESIPLLGIFVAGMGTAHLMAFIFWHNFGLPHNPQSDDKEVGK